MSRTKISCNDECSNGDNNNNNNNNINAYQWVNDYQLVKLATKIATDTLIYVTFLLYLICSRYRAPETAYVHKL